VPLAILHGSGLPSAISEGKRNSLIRWGLTDLSIHPILPPKSSVKKIATGLFTIMSRGLDSKPYSVSGRLYSTITSELAGLLISRVRSNDAMSSIVNLFAYFLRIKLL